LFTVLQRLAAFYRIQRKRVIVMRGFSVPKPSLRQRLMGLVAWGAKLFSLPLVWLLHLNPGERCFGFNGLLATAGVVTFLWRLPPPEAWLSIVFLLALPVRGVVHWVRGGRRPGLVHSQYTGQPLLGFWSGKESEETLRKIEGFCTLGLGFLIYYCFNCSLGAFLVVGAANLLAHLGIEQAIVRDRVLDRIDAELERQADDAILEHRMSPDFNEEAEASRITVTHRFIQRPSSTRQLELIEAQ